MRLRFHKKISMKKKQLFYSLWALLFIAVLGAYSELYDNEFHFDDSHTIQDNPYIRDIGNIPLFFTKGAETFSSLPLNQVYRPMVTTSLAIDYWFSTKFSADGGGFDVHYYHYSMMFTYLLLLVLLYLFIVKLYNNTMQTAWNQWVALFATAWFGLHTVNAETMNYIISRSDLLSTFFVIAAFVIYLYFPAKRKWGLFLIPFIFGLLTKLTAAMFIPLLITYFALFEFPKHYEQATSRIAKKKLWTKYLLQAGTLLLIMVVGIGFVMGMQSDSFTPGGASRWQYLITQPHVLFHYFISFFYPYNLSADTDMTLIDGMLSVKFFIGIIFVLGILFLAFKKSRNSKCIPVSFGILWFFIALAPTSSLIPLAEVMNDHRMFFPFVGLVIFISWAIFTKLWKINEKISSSKTNRAIVLIIVVLILGGHYVGVKQRTEVWDNGKSLWLDVTQKSPKNGRGWMNYGLRLMNEGDYTGAMEAYTEALKFSPKYSYLYTNIAICQNAMGKTEEAEKNHQLALQYGYYSHKPYYYYAVFLKNQHRNVEAIAQISKSQKLAPEYIYSFYTLMEIYAANYDWDSLDKVVKKTLNIYPNDATSLYYQEVAYSRLTRLDLLRNKALEFPTVDNYLSLGLEYYTVAEYDSCIYVSNKILELDPNNISAFNNICAANNQMKNWNAAIKAGEEGLLIEPENQLLINNLAVSYKGKENQVQWQRNTADELIALSLQYYSANLYQSCIDACLISLEKKPNNSVAFNNICSAYNAMQNWKKAIEYGELAVKYAPDFQLAKNNLAYAQGMLQAGK